MRRTAEEFDRARAGIRVPEDLITRQCSRGCREHDVAETLVCDDRRRGQCDDLGEERREGGADLTAHLEPGGRERVDDDDAVGGEQLRELGEELDRRHVPGRHTAREDVDDGEIVAARRACGPFDRRAAVVVLDRDLHPVRERECVQHELEQLAVQFDDVLRRARACGPDEAGDREGAGAQMQHADRDAALPHSVDHRPDQTRVFELEIDRIEWIHVRLRGPLDHEGISAVRAAPGKEPRAHLLTVEFESGTAHASHPRSGPPGRPDAAATSASSEWSPPTDRLRRL